MPLTALAIKNITKDRATETECVISISGATSRIDHNKL